MGNTAKKPEFHTVTIKAKSKKRLSLVVDPSLLNLMKVVGKALVSLPRTKAAKGETLVGIFVLPTNNVVEIFQDADGEEKGHVFASLDVWMNYADGGAA
jgi:hypothetical protein